MIDIIFPATKIKKGSRIVIWGADITGICFCEQIISLKYANVVTFIDSKVENNHLKISINKPEWLEKNQVNYDYILIGSINISAQKEIKKILIEQYNIYESKIIYEGYMPFIKNSGISDINSSCEIVDMLYKFGKSNAIAGRSIQYIIDSIQDNQVLEEIKFLFYNCQSIKTKLVCAYILFFSNVGDTAIMEHIFIKLDEYMLINPMWAHYFIFNTLTIVIGKHPEYRYHNFYLDKKRIMSKISKLIYYNKSRKKLENKKKIAVACSVPLSGGNWHITKCIALLANHFNMREYKVAVFVESKVYSNKEFFIDTYFGNGCDISVYAQSNKKAFHQDIPIYYSEGNSMMEHTNDYVDKIIEYNPGNIIYFGADRTCATKILYDLFPIIYVPTVTEGSAACFHCLACQSINSLLEIDIKYPWIDKKDRLIEYQSLDISAECKNVYTRSNKGWKNSEFIVVTVGNRLKTDFNNEYLDTVCQEIENNEGLKWVIVGSTAIPYINSNYKNLVEHKKIEYIKYEEDLKALYKIVDVYLNPDRVGGGLSIAWAMRSGLPVITLDSQSDGCAWVGKENSIKGNYSDLMHELRKLMHDKQYYEYKKEKMLEESKKWNSEAYINSFIEILNKSTEIFNEEKKEREKNNDTI